MNTSCDEHVVVVLENLILSVDSVLKLVNMMMLEVMKVDTLMLTIFSVLWVMVVVLVLIVMKNLS